MKIWIAEQASPMTAATSAWACRGRHVVDCVMGSVKALAGRLLRITKWARLSEALCNVDLELTENGLDIAIHRLRRELHGSGGNVRTVRGLGYLLEESADA